MAFQQAMQNKLKIQQTRPGLQQFTPGCMRYSNTRSAQHEPLCSYNSLQENIVHSRVSQQQPLHPRSQTFAPRQQQGSSQEGQSQQLERQGSAGRRRSRLSFSRWHMMISSRYKTELCRQFTEDGDCPFEDKCLFAHGQEELRPLPRHPKYKTELCRDFHQVGFCSFGPRCNFIHSTSDVTSLTSVLRKDGRSSTPDSGIESWDDQASSLSTSSASPITTPDQTQDDETFFHFPEGLFREITEGTRDETLEPDLADTISLPVLI